MLKPFSKENSDRDQVLRRFTLTPLGALDSRLERHNLIHRVTLTSACRAPTQPRRYVMIGH